MPKRLCPFGENHTQLKTHIDQRHVGKEAYQREVYEKTKQLMMAGAVKAKKEELNQLKENNNSLATSRGKVNIGPVFKVLKEKSGCYFCKHSSTSKPIVSCYYCNKNICANVCTNVCAHCGQNYCPSCCSINYDMMEERVLCISCLS